MKTVAVGVGAVSMVSFFSGLAYYYPHLVSPSNELTDVMRADGGGAVAGRVVSVPVEAYRKVFSVYLKLGQCPYMMVEGKIKICEDGFEGDVVHLAKGKTSVDVSKVKTSMDVMNHYEGGIGVSAGALGIKVFSAKMKVAVTIETSNTSLNMMSSYEMNKGLLTLHNPHVKRMSGDKSLFLSEIEIGGNEMLLVTVMFESEKKKTEVELSFNFKILFIPISFKLTFIKENFKAEASCKITFRSSWRENKDFVFESLDPCIPKVEEMERFYLKGPSELKNMALDDEKSHYFYYFSSWKASPYGSQMNLALIHHDLQVLNEQNIEIESVINEINNLALKSWPGNIRSQMESFNKTLTDLNQRLSNGILKYHTLTPSERQKLREIYNQDKGEAKAPQYYRRFLQKIISQ